MEGKVFAWMLAILLVNGSSHVMMFPSQAECEGTRVEIVKHLSEDGAVDWGFAEPPYGSVSECVKVPLKRVERKA